MFSEAMMSRHYYHHTYQKDPQTGHIIIPVALDAYEEVYDDWDPSPFKRRDIEDEFLDFLWDSSDDIPFKETLVICLELPLAVKDPKKEDQLKEALNNQYRYLMQKNTKEINQCLKDTVSYLSLATAFLLLAYFKASGTSHLSLQLLREGLFIGGWVFMWESFSSLFFKLRKIRLERKIIKRLAHTDIKFFYAP